MASKQHAGVKSVSKVVHVKYVKRAKMWCKTWFEGPAQKQEWTIEKPL